jgi:hypothetical protein
MLCLAAFLPLSVIASPSDVSPTDSMGPFVHIAKDMPNLIWAITRSSAEYIHVYSWPNHKYRTRSSISIERPTPICHQGSMICIVGPCEVFVQQLSCSHMGHCGAIGSDSVMHSVGPYQHMRHVRWCNSNTMFGSFLASLGYCEPIGCKFN